MSQRAKLMALPFDALQDLVRDALDVLKERRAIESRRAAAILQIGQRVSYTDKYKVTEFGKIQEIRQTKAIVKLDDGKRWLIPMASLKIVPSADQPVTRTLAGAGRDKPYTSSSETFF